MHNCPERSEDEDTEQDAIGQAVDEIAELLIRMKHSTSGRLYDARIFHDMLRERILAEERLH